MPPQDFHSSPFKGLVPYTEEDAQFFFGREVIRDLIIDNLQAWRLTLLYGASGVGKSSVLHAGVVPTLRERARQSVVDNQGPEFSVITFNSWRDDPVAGLARAIRNSTALLNGTNQPPAGPLTLTAALDQWAAETDSELYIILDQFEEYFEYHGRKVGPGTFATEFPRVCRRNQRIKFLISIREEAMAKLDLFKGSLPNLYAHMLRVHPLGLVEARKAIEGPIRQYNALAGAAPVALERELLEAVLQSVKQVDSVTDRLTTEPGAGKIDLTILQQVMIKLWDQEVVQSGSSSLRLQTFVQLGGAQNIVKTHFSSAMERLTSGDQRIAAGIFRYLVTPSGTKISQTAADLADYSGLPRESVGQVLEQLSRGAIRILRAIYPPNEDECDVRYEIFHDVLSGPINEWCRRYEANESLERARLQAIRDRQVDRARYSRRIAMVLSGMLVIAFVLMFYALSLARSERHAREREADATNAALAWADREHKAKLGEAAATQTARDWAEKEQKARADAERQTILAEKRAKEAENEKKKTAEANKLALHHLDSARAARVHAESQYRVADKARTIAENARKTDSSSRAAFRLSRRKDKREEAIAEFKNALVVYDASKDPADHLAAIDTLLNIGEVYLDLGNEIDAAKSFKQALDKSARGQRNNTDATNSLGNAHVEFASLAERAAILTSIGDIYREVVPTRAPTYDSFGPISVAWSPYAIAFQPKEKAIAYYETALDAYDKMREGITSGPGSADDEKRVNSLQAGVFVSLGVAKIDSLASNLADQELFNGALRDIEKGHAQYAMAEDRSGQAYALSALAEAKTRGPWTPETRLEVVQILRRSLADYEATSNLKGKISVLKRMGRIAMEPKEALDAMEQVVTIHRGQNDKPGTASSLVELASIMNQQPADWSDREAVKTRAAKIRGLYLEAADLYQKSEWFDKAAETLMTASSSYSFDSQLDTGPLLERAAELYSRQGRWEPQLNALGNLISLHAASDKQKAISYLNTMEEIAEQRKKPREKATAFEKLGQGYIFVKEFEKADAFAQNAIEQYRLANDSYSQQSVLHRIGNLYLQQSQIDKAIDYLQKSLSLGDKTWEGRTYLSLGDAYARKKDVTRAIEFYERAVELFDQRKDVYSSARASIELSSLYQGEAKWEKGIVSIKKAVELLHEATLYPEEARALMSLGALYEKKGDILPAIKAYESAAQFSAERKIPYLESEALVKISELYQKQGDQKAAEEYRQRAGKLGAQMSVPKP